MNRIVQINRAVKLFYPQATAEDADRFTLGAFWADTHPIYPEGIPSNSYGCTDGEVLSLLGILKRVRPCDFTSKLYELAMQDVQNCKPVLDNIKNLKIAENER